MTGADVDLVAEALRAAGRGDLEAVARVLHPDVVWHGADDEDNSGCHNRAEVLDYIRRHQDAGISFEPLAVESVSDRVLVVLETFGLDEPAPHGEVVTVRHGLITEMVVYGSVEEARVALRETPS